jgi:hypothetical protein
MITFIGLKSRSSGKIRGQQIADNIESANFFDYSEIRKNLDKIRKTVIVVRNRSKDIERFLKRRGHSLGYDILDSVGSDFYFRNKKSDYSNFIDKELFDFYIGNNKLAHDQLEKLLTHEKVYTIPHHHINFKQERKYFGDTKIKTAGYVGLPEQLSDKKDIERILNNHGIEFITDPGNNYDASFETLSKLHLGITNLNSNFKEVFSECKPNTKLSNFQSFGIVTLCNENYSFKQFGANSYLRHENLNQFEDNLKIIIKDDKLRKQISDSSFENSKNFHIKSIKNMYEKIIEDNK